MRTNEELKQLAIDINKGTIFGSWGLREDEIKMVFMLLNLMTPEQNKELLDKKVVHIFEYVSEAGPMAVNGLPSFLSLQTLTQDEVDIIQPMINKLKEAEKTLIPNPESMG